MVLYDDKKWLCRLIRTAFTIEDDSGVCEKVLKEKPFLGEQHGSGDTSSASSEDSFDIRDGADFGHRRRSNTAIRLEKMDKQKKAAQSTHVVRVNPTDTAKNDLTFETNSTYKEEVSHRADNIVSIDSLLRSSPDPDTIPFAKYARFEASCHPSVPFKKIAIFITFLPLRLRNYPIKVAVVATAKVQEVIGLILWLTSKAHPEIKLKPLNHHSLQISDEDGEWDNDFPPLDQQEAIGKFSFSHLALMQAENQVDYAKRAINFTFLLPNAAELKITLPDPHLTTLKDALITVFNKSGWIKLLEGGIEDVVGYHLEKVGNPSTTYTDLNLTLNETKCKDFCVVRNGAKSVQSARASADAAIAARKPDNTIPGARSEVFPVTVTGRFNRIKNGLCVIYGSDRMDLEFQTKTKVYPFSHLTGVRLDLPKNRVLVSLGHGPQSTQTSSSHLQLSTADHNVTTELYHRLKYVIESYPRPMHTH